MHMYSEALSVLDANTVKYMVEKQQEEIAQQREKIVQQEAEIARLRALLALKGEDEGA